MPLAPIGLAYGIAALRSWGLAVERGLFLPLMTLASLANLTLTALLLRETWRRRVLWLAPLFLGGHCVRLATHHPHRAQDPVPALVGAKPHRPGRAGLRLGRLPAVPASAPGVAGATHT